MADCGTPGCPGTYAGSLVGRVRIQKTLRQLSAHWWVKPGLGISAGLLVGRAGSYSLVVGPKGPRYDVRLLEGVSSS